MRPVQWGRTPAVMLGGVGRAVWSAPDPPRGPLLTTRTRRIFFYVAWVLLGCLLIAGALGAISAPRAPGATLSTAYLMTLLQPVPVLSAPWCPLLSWRISSIGMLLGLLGAHGATQPSGPWTVWSIAGYLGYLLLVLLAVRRHGGTVATGVGIVSGLLVVVGPLWQAPGPWYMFLLAGALLLIALALGLFLRRKRPPPPAPADRPENEMSGTTGLRQVPTTLLLGIGAALGGATDPRLSVRFIPSRTFPRVLLAVVWLGFSGGMFGGAVGQMYGPTQMGFPLGIAYLVGTLQAAPLLVAPWFPLMSWRISALGLAFGVAFATQIPGLHWPWPVTGCIVYLLECLFVALRHERRVTLGIGAVSVVVLCVTPVLLDGSGIAAFLSVAFVLIVLVLGDNIRTRRAAQSSLAEQEELHRRDLARQAALEERSRIARELHDVVAHHMSMVAIQAEAAPYKIPELPEEALRTFTTIRSASTTALTEMRRVIGLLRDAESGPERVPQPGMDRLADLVRGARDAGMRVDVEITGEDVRLPPGVDVSAYRIVQEALSNAGRYAPGAPVTVSIEHRPDALDVRIHNAGVDDTPPVDTPSGGNGLVGMRERAGMLGGTITAGPVTGGGFEVHAELPVEPGEVPDHT